MKKAEESMLILRQQMAVLSGGITMLNELITDEETEKQNVEPAA